MASYVMGVDNGGTMTKAAVFDINGKLLGSASCPGILETPAPGFTERNMEHLWQDTAKVIGEAIVKAGVAAEDIKAVACTGHGKGLYLWGKDNRPARSGIISTDTRAEAYITRWNEDGTAAKVYPKTLQKLLVSQPCALLAWVKDNEPQVYDNIQWVLEGKDYIRFRLTGEARAEKTDYSGTGLMNLKEVRFDPELLAAYGIPEVEPCLPPLAEAGQVCGYVTPEASAVTGLPVGTPVAGGMFDIDACAIGSGVVDEKNICVIAGTWSINQYVAKAPIEGGPVAMNSIFCIPPYYLAEESSPTSAGNLEWFVRNILDSDCVLAEQAGEKVYKRLDQLVEDTPLRADGPLFLPYLFGSPDAPQAKATFFGLTPQDGKGDMVRSVFEGIVFGHRDHVEKLLACKDDPGCIRLSGGAANSQVWVQMFADILGLPVETVLVKEPGALGCAIAAAVAAKIYPDWQTAVDHMTPESVRTEPRPEVKAAYDKKYSRYCTVKNALLPVWAKC